MSGKRQDMKASSEMNMGRVQTALSRLKSFQPGKGPDEDFVYLSAKFCDALADSPTYEELRRGSPGIDMHLGEGFRIIRSRAADLHFLLHAEFVFFPSK